MQAPTQFTKRGFIVLYGAIAEERIDELRSIAHFDEGLNWNSDILDDAVVQEERLHAQVPDEMSLVLTGTLKRFYKTFFPRSQVQDWQFIKTLAGSKPQPARREFNSTLSQADLMDACAIPGSAMIATQDNTFFYVFGWNHKVALKSNRVLVELSKGDMMLFRGDLVYKPVGYERKNICVHGYMEPTDYIRDHGHHPRVLNVVDDDNITQDPFCFLWRCQFRGTSLASVRKHINRFHRIRFRSNRRRRIQFPRSVV
ncbi:hypothetical protein DVH05_027330 [Phytophthora capsici]|nr:hypothetical protein DVH05_027330 [Phytophthora capsici]|eukprot:jgi/Phyca11/19890/fgenesh1_pg.PHYCAscaffold_53_\